MATIRERVNSKGERSYQAMVRLKGAPTQTVTFERKTDAKRWVQSVESAIREGRHFKTSISKKRTLAELIERYIEDVLPRRPKSINARGRQLRWWKQELGYLSLADITPDTLGKTRDKLHKGRKAATVVRYLAALSHAFSVACNEWGWLENNPLKKVARPTEPRGRVRFLSEQERSALLLACEESKCRHLYPVVVLAISTGMRQSEILNLKWSDIDLKRGQMVLHETKNGERRSVPLVGKAMALILEMSKVRRIDTELVFYSEVKPSVPVFIRIPWAKAVEEAKLVDFKFHDLRHTAASYLAMNGASLAEIADILGHKTLNMVKRYAHLSEQHTSAVLERMNAGLF